MKLILTGERLTAQRAKELGIVQEVHPKDKLNDAMMALANKIANHSQYSLMIAKQTVRFAFENSGDAARRYERDRFFSLMGLPGKHEGVTAFINKRKADFTGK